MIIEDITNTKKYLRSSNHCFGKKKDRKSVSESEKMKSKAKKEILKTGVKQNERGQKKKQYRKSKQKTNFF